jgi:hypothetical protein
MTQQDDINKTNPVETPYDHELDISEFPTYVPASAVVPMRGMPTRRRTSPYPKGPIGTIQRRPTLAPQRLQEIATDSDPNIVTSRSRALMQVLLPEPPQTEEEVRFCAHNRDVQNHLRWHEDMLRRTYWHILSAPADKSLCMRCRVDTRSVTFNLREIHEALIWLCAVCQRIVIADASILATRFHVPIRQVIDDKLMHERKTYFTESRTRRATPRVTLG